MLSVERYEYSYCILAVDALPLFLIFMPTGQMPEMQYPCTLTFHAGGQPHQLTIFFSLVVSLIVSARALQISMH